MQWKAVQEEQPWRLPWDWYWEDVAVEIMPETWNGYP